MLLLITKYFLFYFFPIPSGPHPWLPLSPDVSFPGPPRGNRGPGESGRTESGAGVPLESDRYSLTFTLPSFPFNFIFMFARCRCSKKHRSNSMKRPRGNPYNRRINRFNFYNPKSPYLFKRLPPNENKELSPNQMKEILQRGGFLDEDQEIEPIDVVISSYTPYKFDPSFFDGKVTNDVTVNIYQSIYCCIPYSLYRYQIYQWNSGDHDVIMPNGHSFVLYFQYRKETQTSYVTLSLQYHENSVVNSLSPGDTMIRLTPYPDRTIYFPMFFQPEDTPLVNEYPLSKFMSNCIQIPSQNSGLYQNIHYTHTIFTFPGKILSRMYNYTPTSTGPITYNSSGWLTFYSNFES